MQLGGELAGQAEVGGAGLDPDQVGVRGVLPWPGRAPARCRCAPGRSPRRCARRCRNGWSTRVDVAGQQVGGQGVGAGDDDASGRRRRRRPAARRSGCGRAATVGTSTLPPRWPHFFSEASWSSQCTPAAPAAIIALHQLERVQRAAEAGLGVGDDRHQLVGARLAGSAWSIWSARSSALLIRRTTAGHRVGRVQALVGVGLAGQVGVGGDLPAGQVDGLQARRGPSARPGCRSARRAPGELLGRAAASTAARRRAGRACAPRGRCRAARTTSSAV